MSGDSEERPDAGAHRLTCANCGAELYGEFCSRCGQRAAELDVPLRRLLIDWLDVVAAFDTRLLRTLKLLLARPGELSREYVAGRRVRYVHPLKLYFAISLVLFVALSFSGFSMVKVSNDEGEPSPAAVERLPEDGSTDEEPTPHEPKEGEGSPSLLVRIGLLYLQDPERFNHIFVARLSKVVFALVVVFPMLLKLLYRRTLYVQHLIFSLHVHSFAFVVMLVALAVNTALGGAEGPANELALPVLLVYAFLAMRRFYDGSRLTTAAKLVVLGVAYLGLLVATMFTTLLLTSLTL